MGNAKGVFMSECGGREEKSGLKRKRQEVRLNWKNQFIKGFEPMEGMLTYEKQGECIDWQKEG